MVPLGLLIAAFDPAFVATQELDRPAQALIWGSFFLRTLLPVTIGNVVGGPVFVGAVSWFVYLRPRAASRRRAEVDAATRSRWRFRSSSGWRSS